VSDRATLAALLSRLDGARVTVVGDVMLDRYVYGAVDRVSAEAPIQVLRVEREQAMLGGAGNVIRNLAALGAHTRFVAAVGDDAAGAEIAKLVSQLPGVQSELVVEAARRTTIKTRFIAAGQQLLRADREVATALAAASEAQLAAHAGSMDGVLVLSDYGKGVLGGPTLGYAISAARAAGRAVVVDPKGADFSRYRGATIIKPNRRELAVATGMAVDSDAAVVTAARKVMRECGIANVLVSLSEQGVVLVPADGEAVFLPADTREVFDVSGAGDTVVAVLAAALSAGATLEDAARLANVAAGIVVGKVGTAVAYPDEIRHKLHAQDVMDVEAKVLSRSAALDRVQGWRRKGLRIGFTNGCFDLLHPGHVSLLTQARAACDRLVVGLNSDASVNRLKGPDRPVQGEASRALVLGSLQSVDLVVVFDEDTPEELIRAFLPDVLVKGADYTVATVVGADIVQAHGGKVLLAELMPGHSTSATIKRMAR